MSSPHRTRFYVDEDLDGIFATTLSTAGVPLVRCRDLGMRGEPDIVWIPRVTQMGLVIISGDVRTRYTPVEKRAIIAAAARIVLVKVGKAKHVELR